MHQTDPGSSRDRLREDPRAVAVDPKREILVLLRGVDGRVGGGVNDHIRRHLAHGGGNPGQTGEIAAACVVTIGVECDKFAKRGQAALQFPADLTAFAEEQDAHQARPL